jgi:hypothetical protein
MSDIYGILSSNYLTVGGSVSTSGKYVPVDPASFEGSWSGKYASGQSFTVTVSSVDGFRAKAKYQSGSTLKYQDVLIRDNAFRIGDSKFVLQKAGVAKLSTVMTNAATGASTLETAYAHQS